MRHVPLVILLVFAFGGSGCATNSKSKNDPVEVELAKSFSRIAESMEQLALIESSARNEEFNSTNYTYDESRIPPIWLTELTLVEDFHGSVEQFIEMISLLGGLESPRIDSPNRGRPKIVAISKGKRKLISFLADCGNQTGDAATIIPSFPLNRVVIKYEQ